MNILEQIVEYKRKEVQAKKEALPLSLLKSFPAFNKESISLKESLLSSSHGIIAEHKRRSPSRSVINTKLDVSAVIKGYENAGVAGISILTDTRYFGGSLDDLFIARSTSNLPFLRKDFMIDAYQIFESKAYGADVILLIAAILSPEEVCEFTELAKEIGLEVLLEVHNREELDANLNCGAHFLGVNNRNLKSFETDLEESVQLIAHIPDNFLKICESGIEDAATIKKMRELGYRGFLIGTHFMSQENPGEGAVKLVKELEGED